jgi:hypothetical protein
MTNSHPTVLIVDRSSDCAGDLRNSFIAAGAQIHVVGNFQVAKNLLQTKVIDAALCEYSTDFETVSFVKALSELGVPCIFTSETELKHVSPRIPELEPTA